MLNKFATALLASALIAGPALAQTSGNSGSSTPTTTVPTKQAAPVNAAPGSTASAPATSNVQTAKPGKTVKHAKMHKKTVKHSAGRLGKSNSRSSRMHQARHLKSAKTHQVPGGTSAKRS